MLPTASRRKKLVAEPSFQLPLLWIHASVAAKCFLAFANRKEIHLLSRRESKRRALLELLDRIPVRPAQAPRQKKKGSEQLFPAGRPADVTGQKKLF